MDFILRKRKLAEFALNVALSPKETTFVKGTSAPEDNERRISKKVQKLNFQETENGVGGAASIWPGKSRRIVECLGKNKKDVEEGAPQEECTSNPGNLLRDNDRTEALWFLTDYIEDIIDHEFYKESLYRLSGNFCRKYDVNPSGREILIDWLIGVQVQLKAENSALHLAVALLDVVLDRVDVPLCELQAAAAASFWVAYKFVHGSLSMKVLLGFCAGSADKRTVEHHEILVLQTSRLIQAGGSLTVFFNYLLYKAFGFKFPPEIYYCGLYFMEIMLLQFVFVECPSFEKAATAVLASLTVFKCLSRFEAVDHSKFVTKQKLLHLYRRLVRHLRLMYADKDALKNSNVYRKYKSSRYYKISIHSHLKSFVESTSS